MRTHTHTYEPYIQYKHFDGHMLGHAKSQRQLTNHEECNLQPELVIIALCNGRATAGDACAEECGAEEPLFANLCDDVHGDGDGGDFD